MESEGEEDMYRHDVDSDDDFQYESDASSVTGDSVSSVGDVASVESVVVDGCDGGVGCLRRGRGTGEMNWIWETQTGNPREWLMDFDQNGVGLKYLDDTEELECPSDFFRLLFPDSAVDT